VPISLSYTTPTETLLTFKEPILNLKCLIVRNSAGTQPAATLQGSHFLIPLFTLAQVLLCSHSVPAVRRRAEALGFRRDDVLAEAVGGKGRAGGGRGGGGVVVTPAEAAATVRRTDSALHMQLGAEAMVSGGGRRSAGRQGHARTDSAFGSMEAGGGGGGGASQPRALVASDSCSSIAFAGGGAVTPRQLSPELCSSGGSSLRPPMPSPPLTRRRAAMR
jgi:hypothetical protein